jgi:uncharacterized protein (DUF58 family)
VGDAAGRSPEQLSPRRTFPLIPRRRLSGTPFGERTSTRRGRGSDVAGTRPYLPGDPVSTIDWFASGRLSAARGGDEFVVRETYAEEAPRVVVVVDRRPTMALYGRPFPWLDKAAAATVAVDAIARAAGAARAEFGHADAAGGRVRVLPPGAVPPRFVLDRVRRAPFDAAPGSLARTLDHLLNRRADLPQGSFVFVLSDFLDDVPVGTWARLRNARWDVVPVVLQDPTWERSFPDVAGVVVPFAGDGDDALVRLSRAEVASRRRENEARLEALLRRCRSFGFDPVLIDSAEPVSIDTAFLRWSNRRKLRAGRA